MKRKSTIKRRLSSIVDPTQHKSKAKKRLSPKDKLHRRRLSKIRNRRKTVHDRVFDKGRSKVLHRRRNGVTAGKGKGRKHKLMSEAEKKKRTRNTRMRLLKGAGQAVLGAGLGYVAGKALGRAISKRMAKRVGSSGKHTESIINDLNESLNRSSRSAHAPSKSHVDLEAERKNIVKGVDSLARHGVEGVHHRATQAQRNAKAKELKATRKSIRGTLDRVTGAVKDMASRHGADVGSHENLRKGLGVGAIQVRKQTKGKLKGTSVEERGFKSNVTKAQKRRTHNANRASADSHSSSNALAKTHSLRLRKRRNNRRERGDSDFI